MILISEWLPNPVGSDTAGEWVELWNNGAARVDLTGWRITADGKKFFALEGALAPGGRAVLPRTQTKLTLRNTDGKLALYNAAGQLHDSAHFLGSAPEGESANRFNPPQPDSFFAEPTPGRPNASAGAAIVYDNQYPFGVPLGPAQHPAAQFTGYLLGTALALAAAIVFILKSHENLSHIFFQGDQSSGSGAG